jgi:hypothetical protein
MIERHPSLLGVARRDVSERAEHVVKSWEELHGKARRVIEEVLDDKRADPRARLTAAQTVIERVEGKTPQKLEVARSSGAVIDSPAWRFAFSWAMRYGVSLAEGEVEAAKDPERVRVWWAGVQEQARLAKGGEVGNGRVVESGGGERSAGELPPPGVAG